MIPLWLIPEITHEKVVVFNGDPYNLEDFRRVWVFKFQFRDTTLTVRGEPLWGPGEAFGMFSFPFWSLEPKGKESPSLKNDQQEEKQDFQRPTHSAIEFLGNVCFRLWVEDIFVNPKGAHIGSYLFNKVLRFIFFSN